MNKNIEKKLRELAVNMAFCHFFCNAGEEDFPETEEEVMDMLCDEQTEKEDKNLVIWEPYKNEELTELGNIIADKINYNLDYLMQALKIAKENEHVYILALTSNFDDEYNEKNYVYREKEEAEDNLALLFETIKIEYEKDCSEKELEKETRKLEESLSETNDEYYQPTFELWTCYGFIKGTVTKTEVQ